jgi:tetratricopeptide (TPR) repeat protein
LLELRQSSVFSADAKARCRVLERVVRLRNVLDDRAAELEAIEALSEQAMLLADDHWKAATLAAKAAYHRKVGQLGKVRSTAASAASIYERLGDASGQVAVAAMAASAAWLMADFDDADAQLARALDVARASGNALLARASNAAATQGYERASARQAHAMQALDLYRSIGDREGEASAHQLLGIAAGQLWQVENARRHFKLTRDLYEALGEPYRQGQALVNAGAFEMQLGCLDEAKAFMERAAVLFEESGATHFVDICQENLAEIAGAGGDAPLALRIARNALAKRPGPRAEARWLSITANAYMGLGDFDNAIEKFKDALPKLRRYKHLNDVHDALIQLGRAYLAKEKYDDAGRCADELLQEMASLGEAFPKEQRPEVLWLAGRVYAATRQTRRAREKYREAREALEEMRAAVPDEETRARFYAIPIRREIAAAH